MEMDVQLLALIVLAVLFVLQRHHWQNRFQQMERRVAELTDVKEDLQRLLAKQTVPAGQVAAENGQAAAPSGEEAAQALPAEETPAPVRHPVVPVGARHLTVVTPKPMVAVQPPQVPVPAEGTVPPEIAAVIMAAVAAYGYSPASIRSIRRRPARSRRWVLAGRLAGLR